MGLGSIPSSGQILERGCPNSWLLESVSGQEDMLLRVELLFNFLKMLMLLLLLPPFSVMKEAKWLENLSRYRCSVQYWAQCTLMLTDTMTLFFSNVQTHQWAALLLRYTTPWAGWGSLCRPGNTKQEMLSWECVRNVWQGRSLCSMPLCLHACFHVRVQGGKSVTRPHTLLKLLHHKQFTPQNLTPPETPLKTPTTFTPICTQDQHKVLHLNQTTQTLQKA